MSMVSDGGCFGVPGHPCGGWSGALSVRSVLLSGFVKTDVPLLLGVGETDSCADKA